MSGVDAKMELAPHKEVAEFRVRSARSTDEPGKVSVLPAREREEGERERGKGRERGGRESG